MSVQGFSVSAPHIPGRMIVTVMGITMSVSYMGSGTGIQILILTWQMFYPLTHLPKLEVFVYVGFPMLSELSEKKIGNDN